MRSVFLLAAIICLGCAASPTPVAEVPERCVCATKSACERAIAAAGMNLPNSKLSFAATSGSLALNKAIASDATAAGVRKDAPSICVEVRAEADAALTDIEPGVLEAIRDARLARANADETTSKTEKELAAWAAYDAALESAQKQVAARILPLMTTRLMTAPNVTKALVAAIAGSLEASYDSDLHLEIARERAPTLLADVLDEVAVTCAAKTIDDRRARWVAVFRAKPSP